MGDTYAMDFWDRVNQALIYKNTTLKWLAKHLNISPKTLYNAMAKKQEPSVSHAFMIAELLDVSVEYLVTGKDPTGWRPPKRISKVIDNLFQLDEHSLSAVETLAEGLALKTKSKNVASGGG